MNDLPERFDLRSQDPLSDRVAALRELVPEAFKEDRLDLDALRRTLGEVVDPGPERFGLSWPGKAECMRLIQEPSIGTLVPMREESVDFDATQNVIIEGENLEVLKLLQKAYYGKVKLIYIDPPYNTGKEFIYPDNFKEGLADYLKYSGQVDDEGFRLSSNAETDGRYHSKWLSMMYPRLFLARNLLREDGVIFVSIDDHEVHNLRALMNEIFGEENFIAELVWEKTRKNDARLFSVGHEYILAFARSLELVRSTKTIWREAKPGAAEVFERYRSLRAEFNGNEDKVQEGLRSWYRQLPEKHPSKKLSRYKWVDSHGPWRDRDISWPGGGGPRYDVIHPLSGLPCAVPERGWGFASPDVMKEQIDKGFVAFRDDHTQPPFRKAHLLPVADELSEDEHSDHGEEDEDSGSEAGLQVMPSVIYRQSQVAVRYLRELLGEKVFTNPKDHEVLKRVFQYCTRDHPDALILDFFAGSGSTGEAVLRANVADGGSRRYLLVQLPEPLDHVKYETISDITRERLRRAGRQIEGSQLQLGEPSDLAFRTYRLAGSNFKIWESENSDLEKIFTQLELSVNHLHGGRSSEAVLTELLLKAGYPLTAAIETLELDGIEVYSVDGGALMVCLANALTIGVFEAMVELEPAMILVLDAGFGGSDELKVNALQTVRARNQRAGSSTALLVV